MAAPSMLLPWGLRWACAESRLGTRVRISPRSRRGMRSRRRRSPGVTYSRLSARITTSRTVRLPLLESVMINTAP
ncbi:hypothetical protein PsYK624_141920 [Phanerochaete sordida]|uniref:Uncharacterized protein n=1 Tax=Phanerochaete sordida TaxID=48140 RepID=A0A9P3GMA5_9APHY|nr:hypothetical protein PsYK624_141920 [Phanerochaete sordida]